VIVLILVIIITLLPYDILLQNFWTQKHCIWLAKSQNLFAAESSRHKVLNEVLSYTQERDFGEKLKIFMAPRIPNLIFPTCLRPPGPSERASAHFFLTK
jgi:hypothetical protein